jgi:hypothetical protein
LSDALEERYNFILAPSVSPQLRIPEQPPAAQTGFVHFLEPSDPSTDLPPVFPKRITVQTVTFSRKPDRQYRIYYDPATWRTRVEELGKDGTPTGKLDFGDAFADYELSADDRTHEVVYDHVWQSWTGPGWLGRLPVTDLDALKPVAAKIIAGVTCEVYEVVSKYHRPGQTPNSDGDLCVTPDGVNLELHSQTGLAPAFTTVQLTYPTNLPSHLFDAPAGWRLKLDPQDVHH